MGSEGRRETLIIVNPAAHNVPSRKRLDEAERWLRSQGWQVERRQTEGSRQATELAAAAAARGLPLLFVCGGDGTLNEAANGLAGSETALGPLRAGPVNNWAEEGGGGRGPARGAPGQPRGGGGGPPPRGRRGGGGRGGGAPPPASTWAARG